MEYLYQPGDEGGLCGEMVALLSPPSLRISDTLAAFQFVNKRPTLPETVSWLALNLKMAK